MSFTDTLYAGTEHLWKAAAQKPFVIEMAKGTLPASGFRNYMLQDYLYLLDYIDLLNRMHVQAKDHQMQAFLGQVIADTRRETEEVHVPRMKVLGIGEEEISSSKKYHVIDRYVGYMRRQLEEGGLRYGLTALLQCSWIYAYIGEALMRAYGKEIAASPYRGWFDAYACEEYATSNERWIRAVDREGEVLSPAEEETLCEVFKTCARYENEFWDALYEECRDASRINLHLTKIWIGAII